jgi:outer membrane protein assembly factor BamB
MKTNYTTMKFEKHLILSVLFCIVFVACEEDDVVEDMLPPRVDFAYTPASPIVAEEILFYADPEEGSGDIASWHWTFGDENGSTSTKRNPYFTYNAAGTYQVTLKVTNESGKSMEVIRHVTVQVPPPDLFPAEVAWVFTNNTPVDQYNEGSNAVAIGNDGTIYYVEGNAGAESKVVAVTDQGDAAQLKWATALLDDIDNAPAIEPDGNIYIPSWGSSNGHIYRLDGQSGAIVWTRDTNAGVSNNTTAIDSKGNLYHGSRSGAASGIFSWAPDGTKRWDITGIGAFYAAPVIGADESTVYYLNTDNAQVWAINAADGTQKWPAPVGTGDGIHGTSLSMGADGTIYFTSDNHVAAVVDNGTTGTLKWSTQVNDAANSGVVIGPGGELYTGSRGGLLSLNPATGGVVWNYEADIVESVPAVDVNGNVYVGTADGKLIVVSPDGMLLEELELADNVVNSPTILPDGTVFVEATDNMVVKLYKITVENSAPADSPWPMKGQNVKNTAVAPE